MSYEDFVAQKLSRVPPTGLSEIPELNASLFPFQKDLVTWALRRGRCAIFADTGLGKQQPTSEPVLTPHGWSTMGALRVSDSVIGSAGSGVRVTGVFPQGVKRVFRLELSDGTFVRAGSEHLWSVRTKVRRYRGEGFSTLTTEQIAASIHRAWQLPLVHPVEYDTVGDELPMDPYALGVLLGDGHIASGQVTACTDNWIGELLGWRKTREHVTCGYVGYWVPPTHITEALARLGLRGKRSESKLVPRAFMFASATNRLHLLHGLMDTDGYPMPDGGAEFCSTSADMFASVCDLVRSLGGVARGIRRAAATFDYKGEKRTGQPAWRVNIKLPQGMHMFRLPRKAKKHVQPTKYPPARIIRRVVDEGVDEPQVCISVDAVDNLYVTRDFIVTHNTRQELEWARCVALATGKRVLILAPLAVGAQTVREAENIGIDARQVRYGSDVETAPAICVTNYDRIHHFAETIAAGVFAGVVCDESSIIKNSDSKTFATLTEMFAATPFRLCATATPSPNDYTELGTHAEFLGICTKEGMLAEYFCHDGGETQKWRLKGHARAAFWRWVSGWGALIRKPSDFGYSDDGYNLPPLVLTQHTIQADHSQTVVNDQGQASLFAEPARTLTERRQARKASLSPRVRACVDVVNAEPGEQWLLWVELNAEADAIADALTSAVEIRGSDESLTKEHRLVSFANGETRILLTKPSIAGWGMNFQCCARMCFVGVKDSYESTYQAIRRCWRFGQTRSVHVHVFASELEGEVVKNLERKERDAFEMAEALSAETREVIRAEILGQKRQTNAYGAKLAATAPVWLKKGVAC